VAAREVRLDRHDDSLAVQVREADERQYHQEQGPPDPYPATANSGGDELNFQHCYPRCYQARDLSRTGECPTLGARFGRP
jgi:hypothetical protein